MEGVFRHALFYWLGRGPEYFKQKIDTGGIDPFHQSKYDGQKGHAGTAEDFGNRRA